MATIAIRQEILSYCRILVATQARIERQLLEDACDDTASRTKRQTQMVDIPNTIVERALENSIPRFSDVSTSKLLYLISTVYCSSRSA